MNIEIKGESLALSEGFSIDLEETSPIFNEEGSQSVSAAVPSTLANRRLLGFPDRLDTASDPNDPGGNAVILSDGLFRRTGTINVTGVSRSEGITFSIGFDNSTAYQAWAGKRLRDLSGLPKIYATLSQFIEQFEILYADGMPWNELAVFPVAVSKEVKDEGSVSEKVYWEMLNAPAADGSMTQPRKVMRLIDGTPTEVTVPEGYGLSPFLHVWAVIDYIFSDLGLKVTENPFREKVELSRLTVLNNTADTICAGTLDYSELMPDCTVEEFLEALWVRFGLVYHIDSNLGTVRMRLLSDILSMEPQDLMPETLRCSDKMDVTYNTPEYIRMSASTSIEGAEPACERFEDYIQGISLLDLHVGPNMSESIPSGYSPVGSRAWLGRETVTGKWWKLDRVNVLKKDCSSGFFNWDPSPESMKAMDLTGQDECVPVEKVHVGSSGTGNVFNGYAPAYLVGARHCHTYVKGSEEDKESETAPLAFIWAYNTGFDTQGRLSPEKPDGKLLSINDGGDPGPTLYFQFADGLFASYWKRYDELLRHGSRTVEMDIRISKKAFLEIDVLRPVVAGGCLCLIDRMEYSLPSGPFLQVTLTLRTISTLGNYDIEKEQNIPSVAMTEQGLRWVFYDGDWQAAEDAKRPALDNEAYQKFMQELSDLETYSDGMDMIIDPMGITATGDWVEEMPKVLADEIPSVTAGQFKLKTFHGKIYYECRMVKRVYNTATDEVISKEAVGDVVGTAFVDYTFDAVYIAAYSGGK